MLSARISEFVSDPLLGKTVEAYTSPLPFSRFFTEFTVDLLKVSARSCPLSPIR
jgi:hypothetical protein